MTPRARTAFRVVSAGVTGLAAFGSIAATGWIASVAAGDYARHQDEKAARLEAAARQAAKQRAAWLNAHPVVTVVKHRRPHRTVVRTITVAAGAVTPGRGGTISRTSRPAPISTPTRSGSTSHPSSSTGTTTTTTTHHPAPPPPPPPAPSSGS